MLALGRLAGPNHRLEKGPGVVDGAPESAPERRAVVDGAPELAPERRAQVLPLQASSAFWVIAFFASPRRKLGGPEQTLEVGTLWEVQRRVCFPESFSFAGRFCTG